MTYPAPLLKHLLVGWQKVADRYNMPIYVFQTGNTYHAVSNEAQGVGRLVDTLAPRPLRTQMVQVMEKLPSQAQSSFHAEAAE